MNKTQKKSELTKDEIKRLLGDKFIWRVGDIEIKDKENKKETEDDHASQNNR